MKRSAFIKKHGRDKWDARQWVGRYTQLGQSRTEGKTLDKINGERTRNQYRELMEKVSIELRQHDKTTLEQMTPEQFTRVLERFSGDLNQQSLNNMRIAGEKGFRAKEKYAGIKIENVKSDVTQILTTRSYSNDAIKEIHDKGLSERHKLPMEIVAVTGIRTHEVITLRRAEERSPSDRDRETLHPDKPGWLPYTVEGKGGMVPPIRIPPELAERLEATRIPERSVTDRKIEYKQVYDLVGGNNLSSAFTRASNKVYGFSNGIHGLRHSYAQRRMHELAKFGIDKDKSLAIVSQEMGHLRPEITLCYLR